MDSHCPDSCSTTTAATTSMRQWLLKPEMQWELCYYFHLSCVTTTASIKKKAVFIW